MLIKNQINREKSNEQNTILQIFNLCVILTTLSPICVAHTSTSKEIIQICCLAVCAGVGTNSGNFTHRVWRYGIPEDIPRLDGDRVILCYSGTTAWDIPGNCTFPDIPLTVDMVGSPFDQIGRNNLWIRMCNASYSEYIAALRSQMGRGGHDVGLQRAIDSCNSTTC